MNNHNLSLDYYRHDRNFLTLKLALKTPKQDFSDSIQNIANATTVYLNSVYKLPGIGTDKFDWYFVEISGTFEDLVLTIVCWQILLLEKHLTVLSR
ncbi:MAG TPA: hypothetical protein V6C71_10805 [Coleofasciculaceae cyanobacterium]|jgi:hypothetical protein